jgi:2'-5' RNA ligase
VTFVNKKRQQLTLFINGSDATVIETIRNQFNPEQAALIKAHVTLCREDEIVPIEQVLKNLESLNEPVVSIDFGEVMRFSEGKGVLLPAIGSAKSFHQLRKTVLTGLVEQPRLQEPHITLLHPRNSTCTDAIFNQIKANRFPGTLEFKTISLIEQEEGKEWVLLREFKLGGKR